VTVDELAGLIRRALGREEAVEIDGLGTFERAPSGEVTFRNRAGARVFIAYAREDTALALRLYQDLEAQGHSPWLDRCKLLPGQNWPRSIEDAIASSDYFIPCFSRRSVSKRGGFQAEIRYALDCARRIPLDEVFLVPVRLDDCRVPARIEKETEFVDLFPEWDCGLGKILEILARSRAPR
jgi:TIR domain